jgi:hypothetical protein
MRRNTVVAGGIGILAAGTLAASPAMAASGTEHFLVVNTSTGSTPGVAPMSATGPIHGHGRDVPLSNGKDRFAFPKGAIVVAHKPSKISQSYDPVSCTFKFAQQGTYVVLSGTGAYTHVHGSGTFTVTAYSIGCGKTAAASSTIIMASGPLSF